MIDIISHFLIPPVTASVAGGQKLEKAVHCKFFNCKAVISASLRADVKRSRPKKAHVLLPHKIRPKPEQDTSRLLSVQAYTSWSKLGHVLAPLHGALAL
ncbi:hypothetical protein RRG08_036090 [Elysia crispata]|uniref:Uncharacterized protein n=1 Tax=Elysia crispata TaxID=231223 RepID=A0AAE1E0R6_9GAST|nr:hypothetical protein RRG08_036090 [Elysia crispata]